MFKFDYNGHDPRLKDPYCFVCQIELANAYASVALKQELAKARKSLKRCSSCQLIYYCSRDCQRKNWKGHKRPCKEMQTLRGSILAQEKFRNVYGIATENTANRGRDWSHGGHTYLKLRLDLVLNLHNIGCQLRCTEIWKEMLGELQEINRLGHLDKDIYDYGARYFFAMYLLNMGRLEDSYTYCLYMVKRYSDPNYSEEEDPTTLILRESNRGAWIYPKVRRYCIFDDFLAQCPDEWGLAHMEPTDRRLYFFTAVLLVKKMLLCMLKSSEMSWRCFMDTDGGKFLSERSEDLRWIILDFLIDFERFGSMEDFNADILRQESQLRDLFRFIHFINPSISYYMGHLPVNPFQGGHEDEDSLAAEHIVNTCQNILTTIPGWEEWLKLELDAL